MAREGRSSCFGCGLFILLALLTAALVWFIRLPVEPETDPGEPPSETGEGAPSGDARDRASVAPAGERYRLTRTAPLLQFDDPETPPTGIRNTEVIPSGSVITVLDRTESGGVEWARVSVESAEGDPIGKGWIQRRDLDELFMQPVRPPVGDEAPALPRRITTVVGRLTQADGGGWELHATLRERDGTVQQLRYVLDDAPDIPDEAVGSRVQVIGEVTAEGPPVRIRATEVRVLDGSR